MSASPYDITEIHGVTSATATIITNTDSSKRPCVSLMVDTTDTYVLTNPVVSPDATLMSAATINLKLTAGVMYYISTAVALTTGGSGVVTYFY